MAEKQWYVIKAIGGKEKRSKSTLMQKSANLDSKTLFLKYSFPPKKFIKSEMVKKLVRKEFLIPVMY